MKIKLIVLIVCLTSDLGVCGFSNVNGCGGLWRLAAGGCEMVPRGYALPNS